MTRIRRLWAVAVLGGAIVLAVSFGGAGRGAVIDEGTPVPPVGSESGPSRALDPGELAQWLRGRLVFDHDFTLADGLGIDFNGDSCRACHQIPAFGGSGPLDVNVFRYGFDNGGAGPFMDLPGGQAASRERIPTVPGRDEFDDAADVFEQRQTPSLFGLGLVDGIFDSEILAGQDPTDADGDDIFGVARMVPVANGPAEVGRFGWKAQIPRLMDFVSDAMAGEIGITTPNNGRGFGAISDNDGTPDPELSTADFDDIVFFMLNLAPPPRGGSIAPEVAEGEMLFSSVGCAKCHTPTLMGPDGPVFLYSNLLLHNVMPGNFRGMSEPGAGVGVYRTPPLWGIGKTAPYMHDGRAETLRDAIMAHASEAQGVTDAFALLQPAEQLALIAFLEDL